MTYSLGECDGNNKNFEDALSGLYLVFLCRTFYTFIYFAMLYNEKTSSILEGLNAKALRF